MGVAKDFEASAKRVGWIHRRESGTDWYFVALDNKKAATIEASFFVAGRVPEIWNAENGMRHEARKWRVEGGRTFVTLDFPPKGSAFVVFRREMVNGERGTGNGERIPRAKRVAEGDALAGVGTGNWSYQTSAIRFSSWKRRQCLQPFLKHLEIVKVAKGDGRLDSVRCNNHKCPCKYYKC